MGLFACLDLESKLMMISLPYCGVCSSSAMTNVTKHRSKDEGGVVVAWSQELSSGRAGDQ